MWSDEEKTAFNLRAKASMREFLRSKTWEEKVESIARMNRMSKIAQAGMRESLRAERAAQESAAEAGEPASGE